MKGKNNFFTLKAIMILTILGAFAVIIGCSAKNPSLFSMKTQPPDGVISSDHKDESRSTVSKDKPAFKPMEGSSTKDNMDTKPAQGNSNGTKASKSDNGNIDSLRPHKDGKPNIENPKPKNSDRVSEGRPIRKDNDEIDSKGDVPKGENRGSSEDKEPALPVAGVIRQSTDHDRKKVAITFDDGPDGIYTPQILDILKEKDAKATFFILGTNAMDYKDVLKRIYDEGHSLGSHSWSHSDFTKISKDKQIDELKRTDNLIMEVTGESDSLFRLPYGAYNDKVLKNVADQGFHNIYWCIDPRDWSGIPSEEILKNVKDNIEPGAIILLHCSGSKKSIPNTVKALPNIIDFLRDEGYEIVTIPELLNGQLYK